MVYSSSIAVNPVTSNIGLSPQGSNYLWALFGIFALTLLTLAFIAHSRHKHARAFHFLALAVAATTTVQYATMASNLGYASVPVEFVRNGTRGVTQILSGAPIPPTRSIFYVRYIAHMITTPLLLLMLLLCTGFALSRIFIVLFFAVLATVCALVGALVPTRYKWAFYTFGVVSLLYVLWSLLFPARRSSRRLGKGYHQTYTGGAFSLAFFLLIYPIVWGLAEGGNVIRVASEMFWYGVLDVLSKTVWLLGYLFSIESLEYDAFQLHSGKFTDPPYQDPRYSTGDTGAASQRDGNNARGGPMSSTSAEQAHASGGDGSHSRTGAGHGGPAALGSGGGGGMSGTAPTSDSSARAVV
ncbi:opsin family protein [Rhodotorula paludigena]|uniref:opsin family protein n=1 Tax=Rhodotorula paludigena TaxID=86838 RepID=UPI00317CBED7